MPQSNILSQQQLNTIVDEIIADAKIANQLLPVLQTLTSGPRQASTVIALLVCAMHDQDSRSHNQFSPAYFDRLQQRADGLAGQVMALAHLTHELQKAKAEKEAPATTTH